MCVCKDSSFGLYIYVCVCKGRKRGYNKARIEFICSLKEGRENTSTNIFWSFHEKPRHKFNEYVFDRPYLIDHLNSFCENNICSTQNETILKK